MAQHDKIINNAAKAILAPEGLFRKGQSRIWLDDNGWFVIMVEFQPSGYSKGSYLNVGVHFLWEGFSIDMGNEDDVSSFDYGYRVNEAGFVGYRGNDENFAKHMNRFANIALDKVKEYRNFQVFSHAAACMEAQPRKIHHDYFDTAMLHFLFNNNEKGMHVLSDCMDYLKNRENNDFAEKWYAYCRDVILPQCTSAEAAQQMVLEMIQRRRALISARPSYKKMKKEFVFQGQEY